MSQEIANLNQARDLALKNAQSFPQVVSMILPIAEQSTDLQVQQWCSRFLYDAFSPENKVLSPFEKQDIASTIIPTLIHLSQVLDVTIYKNVVLTFTAIYDLIFDLVAKTSNQHLWNDFTSLKNFILSRWTSTYPLTPDPNDLEQNLTKSIGSKLASIKFISKVIIVQTPAVPELKDPRLRRKTNNSNTSEISIANVSNTHSVINKSNLDAEAKGLFDSLLNYINDEEYLVPQTFIAIFNVLIFILKRRGSIFGNKILNLILNFDINSKYQISNESLLKYKLNKRFLNRSLKNVLNYCLKSQIIPPQSPMALKASKTVNSIDAKMAEQRKKGITQLKGDTPNKKIKLEQQPSVNANIIQSSATPDSSSNNIFQNTSMIAQDNTYASLYRLIDSSNELSKLDVSQIPNQTLTNIAIAGLVNIKRDELIAALSIVSGRYVDLINKNSRSSTSSQPVAVNQGLEIKQNDVGNNVDFNKENNDDYSLDTTYVLPEPKSFSHEEKKSQLLSIIKNFFKLAEMNSNSKLIQSVYNVDSKDNSEIESSVKINKIAISDWKKSSWLLLLTRLASRGLNNNEGTGEPNDDQGLSDLTRESIFQYFLENIHDRIEVVIEWLNEEWYSEFTKNFETNQDGKDEIETPIYIHWTEKILDSMIPFLESNDRKIFIRLLSDLPFLNGQLVNRVKSLCIDPERSTLGFQSLQFLIMFRPPVKNYCIDILKELYEDNEDLKQSASSLLKKYAPDFLEE